jgi:hypothetical protein
LGIRPAQQLASNRLTLFHFTMPQHPLPSEINDLLWLVERIVHGLETHGPWLGLTQIPAGEVRGILDQVRKAETACSAAMSAKASAQTRMIEADEALTAWLVKARLVVMLARGAKWSERWIETGFTYRGGNIAKRMEPRIALARRLVMFLALHPDFGVPFADVTAARGRSIYERMTQTRDALDVATTDYMMNKRQRAAAELFLRRTMRQVIRMLGSVIADADPRWLDFGLSQPQSRRLKSRCVPSDEQKASDPISFVTEEETESRSVVAAA